MLAEVASYFDGECLLLWILLDRSLRVHETVSLHLLTTGKVTNTELTKLSALNQDQDEHHHRQCKARQITVHHNTSGSN